MKKITLIVLLTGFTNLLNAQTWERMDGPSGGKINQLHKHFGNFYAATVAGLYTSVDGENWNLVNNIPRSTIDAVETIGGSLIVGTYSYGIYRSTNNGTTWTNPLSTAVHDLEVHNGCIFVSTDADGVYKSCNDGQTWTNITENLGGLVPAIASNGSYIFAMSGANLYASTGSGAWNNLSASLPGSGSLMAIAGKTDTLVIVRGNHVYASYDDGLNWTPFTAINNSNPSVIPISLRIQGNQLLVGFGSGNGIWIGNLDGTGFVNYEDGLPVQTSVWDASIENTTLYVGTGSGIYQRDLLTPGWQFSDNGITNTSITDFTASGQVLYASTRTIEQSANRHIYRSVDGGDSWQPHANGFAPNYSISGVCEYQNSLFASYLINLYTSSDFLSYTTIPQNLGQISDFENGGDTLYVGSEGNGIYASGDGGSTFSSITSPGTLVYKVKYYQGELFAGTSTGFHKRTLAGNWVWLNNGVSGTYSGKTIAINNQNIVAGFKSAAYTVLKYSNDNGDTWNDVQGLPSTLAVEDIIYHDGAFYIASDASYPNNSSVIPGIWKSTNNGATWVTANDGLPPATSARKFFKYNDALYVGTHKEGIYRLGASTATVNEPNFEDFVLYPNPTKDWINWQPQAGSYTIHDIQGNYIASGEAVSGYVSLHDLAEGTYLFTLTTNQGKKTVRLVKQH